jgi:lipopolysaccharide/colanic/teichoic acid biosynthesis glycosyltransferase
MAPPTHRYLVTKRLLDIAICLALLVVVVPALALCALAIRLDSPGPVFFTQARTGRDGRRFRMLKLRTMLANAEELKATLAHLNVLPPPDFKIPDDPRITRVGRVLRATSLDELPQIWNVLRGEMSLVGPRPFVLHEADQMGGGIGRRRLDVTPGITGLWQVLGRNDIPYDEMLKLDYLYVTGWSAWWDFQILCKTVPAVLGGKGAS